MISGTLWSISRHLCATLVLACAFGRVNEVLSFATVVPQVCFNSPTPGVPQVREAMGLIIRSDTLTRMSKQHCCYEIQWRLRHHIKIRRRFLSAWMNSEPCLKTKLGALYTIHQETDSPINLHTTLVPPIMLSRFFITIRTYWTNGTAQEMRYHLNQDRLCRSSIDYNPTFSESPRLAAAGVFQSKVLIV